jgi:hypothetical protein
MKEINLQYSKYINNSYKTVFLLIVIMSRNGILNTFCWTSTLRDNIKLSK